MKKIDSIIVHTAISAGMTALIFSGCTGVKK